MIDKDRWSMAEFQWGAPIHGITTALASEFHCGIFWAKVEVTLNSPTIYAFMFFRQHGSGDERCVHISEHETSLEANKACTRALRSALYLRRNRTKQEAQDAVADLRRQAASLEARLLAVDATLRRRIEDLDRATVEIEKKIASLSPIACRTYDGGPG